MENVVCERSYSLWELTAFAGAWGLLFFAFWLLFILMRNL